MGGSCISMSHGSSMMPDSTPENQSSSSFSSYTDPFLIEYHTSLSQPFSFPTDHSVLIFLGARLCCDSQPCRDVAQENVQRNKLRSLNYSFVYDDPFSNLHKSLQIES